MLVMPLKELLELYPEARVKKELFEFSARQALACLPERHHERKVRYEPTMNAVFWNDGDFIFSLCREG